MSDDLAQLRVCACGCGYNTTVARKNITSRNVIKGQPNKFLVGHHISRRPRSGGYKRATTALGTDGVHRLRAIAALGKPLPLGAVVHHADGSKNEDAPLVICQDMAYHRLLHARMRVVRAGGNANTEGFCVACRQVKPREAFTPAKAMALGINQQCKPCRAAQERRRRAAA